MKKPTTFTRDLAAGELADRLDSSAPKRSVFKKLSRFLLSASLVTGLALHARSASAGLSPTPQGAYEEGYATGQAYAAQGLTGTSHGTSGIPDVDAAYDQGFLDGIEGVAPNPPPDDPPPQDPAPPTVLDEMPTQDPNVAFELGYDLGLDIDGATYADTDNPSLDDAFDAGFDDGAAADDACSSTCASCASCGSCGGGGCGGGGCGGCGGCG
jgi:hypothetical protein